MKGDDFFAHISRKPPFTKLHPRVAGFFKDYLAHEKVIAFDDRYVVNTNFPPFPSRAFDNLAEGFMHLGDAGDRRLYSVTLAVTNRCSFDCWHCYNAGRSQEDLPLEVLEALAAELKRLGSVMITLTGGEPLLRDDLERIAGLFNERSCVIVGTTGDGLTPDRARGLRDSGVFGLGISLDAAEEEEHDRMRRRKGAFRTALEALRIAGENGLYPYVVAVATHDFLKPDAFMAFMRFAGDHGAREVHLLEPNLTGNLAGQEDSRLSRAEREMILDYQKVIAEDPDLPILSSYSYLESPEAFGCGAGLTHMYIDGSGEVCPCQFVPMSFGNVAREPFTRILDRMACCFQKPRRGCVGRSLARHIPCGDLPTMPDASAKICERHLPKTHPLPKFFMVRAESEEEVGGAELKEAYDRIHDDYDAFWLEAAAKPIEDLVTRLAWTGKERVFEAGCGTGYATALLAERAESVTAADLSEGMLTVARKRLEAPKKNEVRFVHGDALELLKREGLFDMVFTSWVLGYIPLAPFFTAARGALKKGGSLAFVVHKENSPKEPLEIFAELVARDPSVLMKRVAFDFPRDMDHIRDEMAAADLGVVELWDGAVVFEYETPRGVLDHLLKSGAGTAFYDALDPTRRDALADEFLERLAERQPSSKGYQVKHDYVACVGKR